MGSGIKQLCDYTTYHFLTNRESIERVVSDSAHCNYHVLPSNGDLVAAEVELMQAPEREKRLVNACTKSEGTMIILLLIALPL